MYKSKYFRKKHLLISTPLSYKKPILVFLSCDEKIKSFRRFLEATDFAFVHSSRVATKSGKVRKNDKSLVKMGVFEKSQEI